MKLLKSNYLPILIALFAVSVQACKSKKLVTQPAPPVAEVEKKPEPVPAKPDTTAAKPEVAPPAPKPDYKFSNIQFEFNSGVLKTESYPILDKAAAQMKMDPSVKFVLNGHSSAEGTAEHNMQLSVERADAVKSYLVNAGVNTANLTTKGYGESKPLVPNTSEEGRALNRRVEIKLQ